MSRSSKPRIFSIEIAFSVFFFSVSINMMQSKFIIAEEDDSVKIRGDDITPGNGHDVIPGPPASMMTRIVSRADLSQSATFRLSQSNNMKKGNGMLASPDDLNMSPEIFAQGCMLLQQAALGGNHGPAKGWYAINALQSECIPIALFGPTGSNTKHRRGVLGPPLGLQWSFMGT